MGELLTNINWELTILYYYFVLWGVNALAYGVSAYAIYQWHISLTNLKFFISLPKFAVLLVVFTFIRFTSGLVAVVRYLDGVSSPFETILTLGVVSLALNTTFISLFAIMTYADAQNLTYLDPQQRETLVKTMNVFRSLRSTVKESSDNPIKACIPDNISQAFKKCE